MIVNVTRGDLREEFAMAEEAFALSPISARAALPSEEDYAAISEAFMETSRGRWFLGEYAKRNRNADTSMVLDAVARIEKSLAAQRQATAEADAEAGLAEARLAEAKLAEAKLAEVLSALRGAIEAAQAYVAEALDNLELEQKLAPVRKGARVIREISWRLREIGNDGRICDIIDSQVAAIESGAAQISSDEAKAALGAAFALITGRLAEFGDDAVAAPAADAPMAEAEAPTAEVPLADFSVAEAAVTEVLEASPAPAPPQASPVVDHVAAEVAPALEVPATRTEAPAVAEAALADAEIAEVTDEAAADAHDEAVLDIIAMEMGAPDPFDDDEMADMIAAEAHIADAAPVEPETVAQAPELVAAPVEPPVEVPPPAIANAFPTLPSRRWKFRSARASSRAALCASREQPPTIRWLRSAA